MRHAVILTLLLLPASALADDPKPLSTEDAAKKVNEKVTVEMDVKFVGQSQSGMVFLNSMNNRNDPKNFVVVLKKENAEKLKKALRAEPKDHYKNKTIRVTGTVTLYMNKPQIEVTEPDQVKVVEKK
jgi:DNA/RNA endonuclease YhcR with UshA esterase domain